MNFYAFPTLLDISFFGPLFIFSNFHVWVGCFAGFLMTDVFKNCGFIKNDIAPFANGRNYDRRRSRTGTLCLGFLICWITNFLLFLPEVSCSSFDRIIILFPHKVIPMAFPSFECMNFVFWIASFSGRPMTDMFENCWLCEIELADLTLSRHWNCWDFFHSFGFSQLRTKQIDIAFHLHKRLLIHLAMSKNWGNRGNILINWMKNEKWEPNIHSENKGIHLLECIRDFWTQIASTLCSK